MKGFPTLEGFFTIAGHVTLDKNRVIVEGLSTFTALRGLPASVDLVVVREVWPLVKDLPTLCAFIELLPGVILPVSSKIYLFTCGNPKASLQCEPADVKQGDNSRLNTFPRSLHL